ncbi:MAG: glycosyltransferase family 2 protein [Hyphomicrobium sp.]|uniref:glycosyltransferase family 2 protein n=1 Tax=Hyphomicrobium sp. TaxID=82 RepID=UPI0039E58E19
MADVSIIIPTFNRLWALPEAIESCRNTDDGLAIEIIVVDDGSTDGTWEWLQKQLNVIALRQSNWGKAYAVNHGFAIASGEFVRFLDSDDILAPGANAAQVAEARRTSADVVAAGYIARYVRENADHTVPWTKCSDFVSQQIGECDSSHYSAYLFRKAFLDGIAHRPEFAFRDDRMFVIEVALKGPVVANVDIPCLIHRHHERDRIQFQRGLISDVTNWQDIQMLTKAETLLQQSGELTARRKKALANALWPVAHRVAATHLAEACKIMDRVKRLDPEFRIPHNGLLGRLHRVVGFRATELGLRFVRVIRNTFLDLTGIRRAYAPPRV